MLTRCGTGLWTGLSCYHVDGAIAVEGVLAEVWRGVQIPIEGSNTRVANWIWVAVRRILC